MRLFIAEKPSLGKGIAVHLGRETNKDRGFIEINNGADVVTWCFGHILEQVGPDEYLPAPTPDQAGKNGARKWMRSDLPIVPKNWRLRPSSKDNAAQFRLISSLLKKADEIVVAGDPDREGQLLIDEVLIEAGVNPEASNVKRIWLAALDDDSVKKALSSLKPNAGYRNLRESALARSRADWLIGMNGTRAFTLATGTLVKVGRVQTPTMAMVVRRDELIANFKPVDFFVPYVEMPDGTVLEWVGCKSEVREGLDPEGRISTKALAEKIVAEIRAGMEWRVDVAKSGEVSEAPPLPHSLDSLQMHMNAAHKMSAQRTLDACQALYETHKLTTYPRSDCRFLPLSMYEERDRIMKGIEPAFGKDVGGANPDIKTAAWNDSKVTAHHAIIPTGQVPRGNLSPDEKLTFETISKFYIAQFYPPAKYQKSELELLFGGEDRFRAAEKSLLKPGWKSVLGNSAEISGSEDGPARKAAPSAGMDKQ